jgi:hypothetical protein
LFLNDNVYPGTGTGTCGDDWREWRREIMCGMDAEPQMGSLIECSIVRIVGEGKSVSSD